MKKVFLIVIFTCLTVAISAQTNLTSVQKEFQSKIIQFLNEEEGFSPRLNQSNTIVFNSKNDGEQHWISIYGEAPFFVMIHREGYPSEGYNAVNRQNVLLAANKVNETSKAVKLFYADRNVLFSVEQYVHTEIDLFYVFSKNMENLANAKELFLKEYKNLQNR